MGTDRPIDNFRYYNYEFYAQDSWKVKSNFTLEYGCVSATCRTTSSARLGILFDPSTYNPKQGLFINGDHLKPNGILRAATGQIPLGVLDNNPPQWMPRLNFAWDVGGKGDLVVRAGAGIFYNRVQGNYDYYSSGQLPNTYSAHFDTWSGDTGNGNGLTFGGLNQLDPFSGVAGVNVNSRNKDSNDIPRGQHESDMEKRLPWNNILSVAYVGTEGRHLPQQRQLNFVPLGRCSRGQWGIRTSRSRSTAALDANAIKLFRPYTNYDSIGLYEFTGTSSYHSMQATLSRQAGKNLQYFVTYTFSKALGTVATNESDGSAWADPVDTRGRSWGVLPFDRTHIVNLSYNYNLPDLAKVRLITVGEAVLNGWQMSGITFSPAPRLGCGSL